LSEVPRYSSNILDRMIDRISALEARVASLEARLSAPVAQPVQPSIEAVARAMGIAIRGDGLVSEADAATMLGIAPRTLQNWYYNRPLRAVRVAGKRHYRLSDIAELMQEK
jgi:CRP-like cAMP-binding protein